MLGREIKKSSPGNRSSKKLSSSGSGSSSVLQLENGFRANLVKSDASKLASLFTTWAKTLVEMDEDQHHNEEDNRPSQHLLHDTNDENELMSSSVSEIGGDVVVNKGRGVVNSARDGNKNRPMPPSSRADPPIRRDLRGTSNHEGDDFREDRAGARHEGGGPRPKISLQRAKEMFQQLLNLSPREFASLAQHFDKKVKSEEHDRR